MTEYATVPVPDENDVIEPPQSDDPTCFECGTPLSYSGRGRKPKWCDEHKPKRSSSGGSGRRSSSDVAQAMAILDGMYHGLTMALMAVSPKAAAQWNAKIPDLQSTNNVLLSGDKKLCQSICKMGQGGGRLAFAAAHVMAVAPVVVTARSELTERAASRRKTEPTRTTTGPTMQQPADAFPNAGFFA